MYPHDFSTGKYVSTAVGEVLRVHCDSKCDPSGDRLVDLLLLIAVINCYYYTVSGGMEDDDDDDLRSDVEEYGLA